MTDLATPTEKCPYFPLFWLPQKVTELECPNIGVQLPFEACVFKHFNRKK
jgi:hypothetical protein